MKTNLLNMLALTKAKAKGRKCVIYLASFFLLLSPLHLMADEYTVGQHFTYGDFEYEVLNTNTRTLIVYGCSGSGVVSIPSSIHIEGTDQTWSVVKVAGSWQHQSWSNDITGIVLPESIQELGNYCFVGSQSIQTLVLPTSLQTISESCFLHIGTNVESVTINGESDYFETGVDGALYTKGIKELVYVPSANGITTFNVPEGVTKIRSEAFASHQSLETINISSTVEVLSPNGDGGISPNNSLKHVNVDANNTRLYSIDGVVYDSQESALILYPCAKPGTSFTVPDNITKVETYGLYQSKYLKEINLNNINQLCAGAIQRCTGLTSLTLPVGLAEIPDGSISGCSNIQCYDVHPDNPEITSIDCAVYSKDGKTLKYFPPARTGDYTFPENTVVENIVMGSFVSSKLSKITIPNTVKTLVINSPSGNLKTVEFEDNSQVEYINFGSWSGLETITFPTSVRTLGSLYNCPNLKKVIVPDGSQLETIASRAFWNDNMLEEVVFEGSCTLKSIGSEAFVNCKKLKLFTMPASVVSIGNLAFGNCDALETVVFSDDAVITTIGQGAFSTSGIQYINLPPSLITIEREAFRECEALHTVNVGRNAANISPEAFKLCENLTAINVVKANQTYSSWDGILLTKNKETLVIFPAGKGYSNFTLLPPSLKSIGEYAFYDCKQLTNVVIPNKVASIGQRAFGLCSNLNTVTFLCDDMIDPDNIVKGLNISSFDDDVLTNNPRDDTRGNITLNVRKELLSDYQNTEFYQKFKGIEPSFIDNTSRVGGLNKSNAKEEFIVVSDNAVDLLSVVTDDETYVLPTSVTIDNKSYAVKLVGDYLFTATGSNVGNNVKEVVVPGEIEYIGARAFMKDASLTSTSSNVGSVFIVGKTLNEDLLSTVHFGLTADDLGSSSDAKYDEFGGTTNIYVRESAENAYKTAWTHYADNISYQIPYTQSGTFGTFAREFDVDFSKINGVNEDNPVTDDPVVIAFTGDGKYNIQGDSYYVHMTSINLGDQTGKDGTYIPAGSGVLIKKYREPNATSGTGLYYQIAETETGISPAFVDGNFMKGVTLRKETIETVDGFSRFYISGGKLHEMTQAKQFGSHKSFMEISNADIPAGSKVMLSFIEPGDETEATGIENLRTDENADDADKVYYNLNGQRVYTPSRGIYILNGKKVIVK